MSYKEFINNIINTRGQWNIPEEDYCESHHILPKCMGGLPKGKATRKQHNNLIWLTPREHFIAHKLLMEENKDNKSICAAYWQMCISNGEFKYDMTPEEYELGKIAWVKHMQEPKSDETKLRIHLNYLVNENFGMTGKKHTEEAKSKIGKSNSIALKGRKIPKETVENMTKAQIGLLWWTNGIDETKSKDCPFEGWYQGRSNNVHPGGHKVECIETGEVFITVGEASKACGGNVSQAIRKNGSAGGLHWRYYND